MPYKNPEDRRTYFRNRHATDPAYREKVNAKGRARYAANIESENARGRAYYAANPRRQVATREELDRRNTLVRARRQSDPEKYRKIARDRLAATDEVWKKDWNLRKRYGITFADQQALIAAQGGLCPVCRKPLKPKVHTDHDHITKTIRGITHPRCNTALGALGDNVEGLTRALVYVSSATVPNELIDEHW